MHKTLIISKHRTTYRQRGEDDILKQSAVFMTITGFICMAAAIIYAIFESINRFSEPGQIILSLGLTGIGILFILIGLNLLLPLKINTGLLLFVGSILSVSGILGFALLYPYAWFYPKVAYIMLAYAVGILLLLSNIILQQLRNSLVPINFKAGAENIERGKTTMFSGEGQLTAVLGGMMVSNILHPVSEFSLWNSTCPENKIYEGHTAIIPDESEDMESLVGKKPEMMLDMTPESQRTVFSLEATGITNNTTDSIMGTVPVEDTTAKTSASEEAQPILMDTDADVKVIDTENIQSMKRTDIKKDDHMQEAAHKILRFHFGRMLKHERGTMLGKDIEELHDMRVAAMRMRSVLQVFNGHLDMNEMMPFFRNIKATRRSLGAVRDLDVFMEKIQHYIESLPEQRVTEMDKFIDTLLIERDKSRGMMLLHLDSSKYNKFKLKFTRVLQKNIRWEEKPVGKDGRPLPHIVRDVLPPLLYNQLATVRAYDDLVHADEPSYEMLHALRIDVKILRYTLEFFEEVLGEDTKSLVKDLKGLQDNLGDIHDAVVAIELLQNYIRSGKWGVVKNIKSGESNIIVKDAGIDNYLAYRRDEISILLEAFPKVWSKVLDKDFGIQFSSVISSLYKD